MPGLLHPNWTPGEALILVYTILIGLPYAFCLLAYPPSTSFRRKLSILILAIPTFIAFRHSDHVAPNYDLVDTFARTCIIWFAHMSYEVCIIEFTPDVQPGPGEMRERFRQAKKVFFDRSHTQMVQFERSTTTTNGKNGASVSQQQQREKPNNTTVTDKKTDEPIKTPADTKPHSNYLHGKTRWQLVRYHIVRAALMYGTQHAFESFISHYSPVQINPWTFLTPDKIPFFSRLPAPLYLEEFYWRTEEVITWVIACKWLYEFYHSVFAALHVGLGLDGPEEWSLQLFGSLRDAWSVRRYWRYYWHNYIYHSFLGHVKCVTRGWLGLKRGRLSTRLVENTLVFFLSGLMHSLVRWQEEPEGDLWAITWLYTAQMIPIVIEGVVVYYWRQVRRGLGYGADVKWLNRAEYAVGYFWVFCWHFYSIPTYWLVKELWTQRKIKSAYMAKYPEAVHNRTGMEN